MKKWLCIVCGLIYDEAEGWPSDGIVPGTRWEDVPVDWVCPDCGVGKADFEMIEIIAEDEPVATSVEAMSAPTDAPVSVPQGPLVIIGSGHAGYGLAEAVRARAVEREIHVFTADDGGAYSKPALSNALALNKNADSLLDEPTLAVERRLGIRVHAFCPVERIDTERQCLITRLGEMPYGELVLAIGARPIRIPVTGDQDALLSVNNRGDYREMRRRLDELGRTARVAIIGDGLIGCEFANDLAQAGHAVSVIGLAEQPLPRLLTAGGSRVLQTALSALGVDWYLQRSVSAVQAEEGSYRLTLTDDTLLEVDLVVSAVGLVPNIDLAAQAGIDCNRGNCVDEHLATSVPHIHAIGDAVEIDGQLLPYLAPINVGLRTLAATLCGTPTPVSYPTMPVMVKTPAAPICVVVPPAAYDGRWQETHLPDGIQASCYDPGGVLIGFILVGETAIAQRGEWLRHCGQANAA